MGCKTLYTEERIGRLLQAIKLGATYQMACKFAGFSYRAFRGWMKDAEDNPETSKYRGLPERVRDAEGAACVRWLGQIEKASSSDWKAAAWKLERRYPGDFGKRAVEFSGPGGGPIQIEKMPGEDDAIAKLIRRLEGEN